MKKASLLAPALIVLLAVTAWPLGRALYDSLFNYPYTNPGARRFVGIDNYRNVLGNAQWWQAVAWAMATMVLIVGAQMLLGFLFANVLNHLVRALPVARILVLLPFAAMSFLVAFTWREAFNGGYLQEWFHLGALGEGGTVIAMCLAEIWRGTGIVAVILLTGLLRVSPGLMQSAIADGATLRHRFTRIVLPAIGPAAAVAVVYRALDTLRAFDSPYVAASSISRFKTPQTWIFDTSLNDFEFGLGATMSVVFFLLTAIIGVVLVRSLRSRRAV